MLSNKSKVVLITGCSSGFGLLTAVHLSRQGFQVIATMRNLSKQNFLKRKMMEYQCDIDIQQLDVIDITSIDVTVSYVINQYKVIDVLINNAGYGIGGCFEDLTQDEIRAQMETNFFGVQNVTRAVLPYMRAQRSGRIINLSSVSGLSSYPAFSAYTASKWALEAFSESLLYELKFFGIQIALLEPGSYPTEIFEKNIRYAKRMDDENSAYFSISQFLKGRISNDRSREKKNPMDIPFMIEKIINQKKPSFRNIPDKEAQLIYYLRKILPFQWYSQLLNYFIFKGYVK